jgi:predicted CXXCH cytochrome family protein
MCGPLFRSLALVLSVLLLLAGSIYLRRQASVRAAEQVHDSDSNAVCAPCHREICERYRATPMAHASGPASDGFIAADFNHRASGVHYVIGERDGQVWMSYERDDAARPLNGREELRFFIGSGKRGRTFLFEKEGYWFESPINWYARKGIWDMTPNDLSDREMPLTLPVDSGCLHCHASGVVSALPDARNHYASAPFAFGGITCSGCHGNPAAHVASQGKVHMLNIAALEPARRDSVCLNCHLEGQAAVDREGRESEDFAPGDNLSDYTLFFVYRREPGSGGRATSQWEALLQSECKRKSGERLTCITCHDPHGSPSSSDRIAYYRQRCLTCHNQAAFAARHHPENPDCTACHMARAASTDIAHEQVTDHLIKTRIATKPSPPSASGALEAVGESVAPDRELGIAYAQMFLRGDREAGDRAIELLRHEEKQTHGATGDAKLHSELGFLEQVRGDTGAATIEYGLALNANPYDSLALGDLALIKAQHRQYGEAERLLKTAFDHDPIQIAAGLNLAIIECQTGNGPEALRTLDRVLLFDPDNSRARSMSAEIHAGKKLCSTPIEKGL